MKRLIDILTFRSSILLLTFLTISIDTAYAESTITAQALVEKASLAAYYAGNDGRATARMKIVDANGRKQIRQFSLLRKDVDDAGEQKFLLVFSRPTDVKGTVFMVHKQPLSQDQRWLYLPALDLVKRISAGDKRTSFVGSHFFYEDISGRLPDEDTHEIISENKNTYILKHIPKEADSVEFSFYKTWINKENFLPMKIEFYDSNHKQYRRIESIKVEDVQGIATVTKSKATNLLDNSYTLMEFRRMVYDLNIPDKIFNERSLRNPPVKWLKKLK